MYLKFTTRHTRWHSLRRSKAVTDEGGLAPEMAHPATYSGMAIWPAEHARSSMKQHIEHVVPRAAALNEQ